MLANTPRCDNCDEALTPRGGLPPRFCPRCGRSLGPRTDLPQARPELRPQRVSGVAVAALVVGIVALPSGCPLIGVAAILLGVHARMRIGQSRGQLSGDGLAIAGIVLGVIGSALWAAVCAAAL